MEQDFFLSDLNTPLKVIWFQPNLMRDGNTEYIFSFSPHFVKIGSLGRRGQAQMSAINDGRNTEFGTDLFHMDLHNPSAELHTGIC